MSNKLKIALNISLCLCISLSFSQTVSSWLTKADRSVLIQKQSDITFTNGANATITIDENSSFQTIDGYGFCLTEGSTEAISQLSPTLQDEVLNEFFNPETGMGNDVVRISIGASDLSSSSYSYNDNGPDPNLNNFSLAGPDLNYLIPVLKRILAINPNIKILATPWSAPRWMKSNNAWIGGTLKGEYYQAYAEYFVKYLNAMRSHGIEIWGITVQNEPENPYNEPSMVMDQEAQLWFINAHLGPTMRNAGYNTKIIAFDHNLDNTDYPIRVAGNSDYVDGSAFHLYAGDISAMTTVKNATNKNVYFTEQYTDTKGSFSGDFGWHMQNVMIGSMNNWGKIAMEWNLATDANHGPKTPRGCSECLGAITVNNNANYTRNVSYYIIAQFSKFVRAGAVRIGSSTSDGSLHKVAFKNMDGTYAVVVFNSGGDKNISIGTGSKSFSSFIPGYSAITFTWEEAQSTTGLVTTYNDCNYSGFSKGFTVGEYTMTDLINATIGNDAISSLKITEGYKAVLYEHDNFTGKSTTINSDNNCLNNTWNKQVTSLKILPNGEEGLDGIYYLQNKESGLYMDAAGGETATSDGVNIHQWELTSTKNQQFNFLHLGNGAYKIAIEHSGKTLDIDGIKTTNGANTKQWSYFGSDNQKFIVVPTNYSHYKLVAMHSGRILEVENASHEQQANVQQFDNNNQACGQWNFIPVTITGSSTNFNTKNIQFYPNPVKDELHIETNGSINKIEVYSMNGQLLIESKSNQVPTASLIKGTYILKIITDSYTETQRFTKVD